MLQQPRIIDNYVSFSHNEDLIDFRNKTLQSNESKRMIIDSINDITQTNKSNEKDQKGGIKNPYVNQIVISGNNKGDTFSS